MSDPKPKRVLSKEQKDKMAEGRRKAQEEKKAAKATEDAKKSKDDTKTDKPKRVLSDEQKAKMAEGRKKAAEAKKAAKESGDDTSIVSKSSKKPKVRKITVNMINAIMSHINAETEMAEAADDDDAEEIKTNLAIIADYMNRKMKVAQEEADAKPKKEKKKDKEESEEEEESE